MKTEEELKQERIETVMDFLTRPDISIETIRYYQGEIAGLKFPPKEKQDGFADE